MTLRVSKSFQFAYAHRLPGYEGVCKNIHGHTGTLEVEIVETGDIEIEYAGMVIDFARLKEIVHEHVILKLDHKYLNDFMEVPTAENIVLWIKDKLEPILKYSLCRIRLYESPTSFAEWRRNSEDT